jgi:hypothetical protein
MKSKSPEMADWEGAVQAIFDCDARRATTLRTARGHGGREVAIRRCLTRAHATSSKSGGFLEECPNWPKALRRCTRALSRHAVRRAGHFASGYGPEEASEEFCALWDKGAQGSTIMVQMTKNAIC